MHFPDLEVCCDWSTFFIARLSRLRWEGLRDEQKERLRRRLHPFDNGLSRSEYPEKHPQLRSLISRGSLRTIYATCMPASGPLRVNNPEHIRLVDVS